MIAAPLATENREAVPPIGNRRREAERRLADTENATPQG
jgi:hypothetical protein